MTFELAKDKCIRACVCAGRVPENEANTIFYYEIGIPNDIKLLSVCVLGRVLGSFDVVITDMV